MIINTESLGYFVMQTKTVPWGPTSTDFVKYTNANPGKAKYGASNPGSGTDIGCSFVLSKAGVLDKVKKITSKNTAEGAKNVAAGAADIGCTDAQRMIPHLEAGRVTPLMWTGPQVPPPFDKDPNIITWEKAGISKGQLGAMTAIATTKEVPKAHVEITNQRGPYPSLHLAGNDAPRHTGTFCRGFRSSMRPKGLTICGQPSVYGRIPGIVAP